MQTQNVQCATLATIVNTCTCKKLKALVKRLKRKYQIMKKGHYENTISVLMETWGFIYRCITTVCGLSFKL